MLTFSYIISAECNVDSDCPYDRACIGQKCLDPCRVTSCGRGAECRVQSHQALCFCPQGTQGNALTSCVAVQCQYNEDCADHEACDRLNRVCRPVCEEDTCAVTAQCVGRQHQAMCQCPAGTNGNPYLECKGREPVEAPECEQDADCPSQHACINQKCQNPCKIAQLCSADQKCKVQDTLPLRTVMCECPPDTITDSNGVCRTICKFYINRKF